MTKRCHAKFQIKSYIGKEIERVPTFEFLDIKFNKDLKWNVNKKCIIQPPTKNTFIPEKCFALISTQTIVSCVEQTGLWERDLY